MKINTDTLIVLAIVAIAAGLGGFFIGHKATPEPVVLDTHKIDSIMAINQKLDDSLKVVNLQLDKVADVKIIYRKQYDTIRISDNAEQIARNLRAIVTQPITD